MKTCLKFVLISVLSLSLATVGAFADEAAPPADGHVYSQAELDQILAPIALYPDSLLSQVLMAATYPLEVVEAARWSKANSNMTGEYAVRAVDDRNWDPSVKSLVAFPQILAMMDEKLDWTQRLGDAFLGQQDEVMNTVQDLRQKAYASGNLRSDERIRVDPQPGAIVVEPTNPQIVYVPYYDPMVVYGPWWWAAYPPVFWRPWPGYYVGPGVRFAWGFGVAVGAGFFFSTWDWHHHFVRVVAAPPFYYHRPVGYRPAPDNRWSHDPYHRRGVPYRNPSVRDRYRHDGPAPDSRRNYRGYVPPSAGHGGQPGYHPPQNGPGRRAPDEHHGAPPGGGDKPHTNPPGAHPTPNPPSGKQPVTMPGKPPENSPGTPPGKPPGNAPPGKPPGNSPPGKTPGDPKSPNAGNPPGKNKPPTLVYRPRTPDSRPHALEGVGNGKEVRGYSERGRASEQGNAR